MQPRGKARVLYPDARLSSMVRFAITCSGRLTNRHAHVSSAIRIRIHMRHPPPSTAGVMASQGASTHTAVEEQT